VQVANKAILTIKPYVPGKPIEDVKRELGLKSVIKLASNENPYPPSKKVLAAIKKAALSVNRYPDGSCFELRKALAKRLKVNENQLIFGNGSDEVIVLAVKAYVGKGDEVIIADPSFLVYDIAARLAQAKIHAVPLKDFRYDVAAMKAKLSNRTKIVFIGNPDNPSGTFVSRKDLEGLIKAASKDTLIFIDEAYFEYVIAQDYPDGINFVRKYPNVLVTRTFSKMYGLAGLRVGYGVASSEIIDTLNRLREPFNVNSIAQSAAIAALEDEAHYKKIAIDIEKQRQYLYSHLTAAGLKYIVSFTNFILVYVGGDSTNVAQGLLKKGVIIRDMNVWGLKGYIRVSIGTASENKRFIKSLVEVL
jgi:histidinol-phosphate aminotransferase